jgi:hypothetical protein
MVNASSESPAASRLEDVAAVFLNEVKVSELWPRLPVALS